MFEIDEHGNKLYTIEDGAYLKLADEKRPRKILDISEDGVFSKYVKKENIFHKTNSIGFNYHLLVEMEKVLKSPTIKITIDSVGEFELSVKDILEEKQFLNYKNNGFEVQCFYPVGKMKVLSKCKIYNIGDKVRVNDNGGVVEAISSSGKTLYVRFGKQISVVNVEAVIGEN